jgi:hypothetical protein
MLFSSIFTFYFATVPVLNILQKCIILNGFDFFKMDRKHDKAKKNTPAETLALRRRRKKKRNAGVLRHLESKLTTLTYDPKHNLEF